MLAVLERLESLLKANGPGNPPDAAQADVAALLDEVAAALGNDVGHHYAFEETHLFPRFAERGGPGIPEMLRQEHDIIRPLAEGVAAIIAQAKIDGFSAETWAEFRETGGEVAEREVFHIQKEEMGFLPALNQMLDADDDGPLQAAYAAMKDG